jgi:hypothetical protein
MNSVHELGDDVQGVEELTVEEQSSHRLLVLSALEDAFPNALGNQQIARCVN